MYVQLTYNNDENCIAINVQYKKNDQVGPFSIILAYSSVMG